MKTARPTQTKEAAPAASNADPKSTYGMAKPSTFAIPPSAIILLGQAMTNGAEKYGLFNWRNTQVNASVYYDAIQRHLADWRDGYDYDADSNLDPLVHVMACCAILLDAGLIGTLHDDRGQSGTVRYLIERLTKPIPA